MSIRNLKDGSNKPWICECYPNGRDGKRIRKRFATKGEATAFERFTMNEINDKPWLGVKADNRRLKDLLDAWWEVDGHTVKPGQNSYDVMAKTIAMLNNPLAQLFTKKDYLAYLANRVSHHPSRPNITISTATHNIELKTLRAMFSRLIKYDLWELPNPLTDIELVKSTEKELSYLTKEQIPAVLSAIAADSSLSAKQIHTVDKTGGFIADDLQQATSA